MPARRHLHLHLGHLADAFVQRDLHQLIHTLTHRRQNQPCKRQPARQEQLGLSVLLRDTSTRGSWGQRTLGWEPSTFGPEVKHPEPLYSPASHLPSH
jgi:hypothetical protein